MKTPVIHPKYLPIRFPLFPIITTFLVLDRLRAPEWVWGGAIVMWAIMAGTILSMGWDREWIDLDKLIENNHTHDKREGEKA